MSDGTKIEWADSTWNPTRGCSRVSEGCRFCYAEKTAHRYGTDGAAYAGLTRQGPNGPQWTGEVRLIPESLLTPYKWRKPRRIFVDSMSDLFHLAVPDNYIDRVFGVMLACAAASRGHVFMILTKRPERMRDYLATANRRLKIVEQAQEILRTADLFASTLDAVAFDDAFWPIPGVWLGVSVEHQPAAEQRIPVLLETPAALRFLSCEPLLGPLSLAPLLQAGVDWVIGGGESGASGRPMERDWIRGLRDQCVEASVPFFFKQWGEWVHEEVAPAIDSAKIPAWAGRNRMLPGGTYIHVGRVASGAVLDGREWREWPDESRPRMAVQPGGGEA